MISENYRPVGLRYVEVLCPTLTLRALIQSIVIGVTVILIIGLGE